MNGKDQKHFIVPILLLLILAPLLLAAAPAVIADLPPRPTAEPTKQKETGAYIQLQVSGATVGSEGVWTKVQWVDEFSVWHDVNGWQGTVELDGTQTWWVAPDDLDRGPFRWVILSETDGTVLATSDSFHLPDTKQAVQIVSIAVE